MTKQTLECRNCGDNLGSEEKSYGWGDTCVACILETAGEEEIFALKERGLI